MSLSDIIGKIRKKTNEVWQRESEEYKQSGNYKPSSEYGTSGGQDNTSAPSVLNSGGISPSPFDSSSWLDRYHNVVEPNREAREQIESDMDFLYPLRNAGTLDWRLEQQKQKAERAANYTFPNSADKDTFNPNPDIAGAMDDAAGLPTETEDQKRLRELRERSEQYDYFPSKAAREGFAMRPLYGTIPDSLLQDWQREAIDKSIEFEEKRNVRDANEHPILSSYESVAGNLVNAAMFPYAIADYLSTGRLNEDAKYNDMGKRASTIRSTVGGNINSALGGGFLGDAGEFLYGTGMSMIDSAARTALFGQASIGVAGMGAATDAMREGKEKGYSDDRAFWQGIAAGVLEGAFEKLPTDALFDTDMLKKSVGGYIAKNALSEGVEEGGTTISNKIVDYLGGLLEGSNNSDVVNTYNKHRANNESNGRAIVNTLIDIGGEVLLDTIGGLLSGGSMAGVGAGVDTLDYKTSGKRVYSELLNFLKGTDEDSKTANTQMVLDYSKVLGKAGQTVINEMYDPNSGITALDYIPEMTKYYEAGRNGTAMNSVTAKPDTNVTAEMRQAAYIAGQSDARTSTASKTRTEAKTSESAQTNANRANSSDSSQASNITSNTQTAQNDRTDLGTQENTPADTQATRASHVQTTSTAGLGIDGGSTTDSVSVINGRLTKAMKTAQQIVSERGKQLVLVSGNMNVDDQRVRGIVVGDRMFVQADNPQFTSEQIVRNVLEDGRIDLDTQRSILADNDIETENVMQEVQNNDEQTGTAEVGVRRGGERTDSAYSGRQTGAVAEGTGSAESRRRIERGRAADGEAASLTYGEKVSTASLGIGGGADNDAVRVVKNGMTKAMKNAKKEAAKRGKRITFVSGNMTVNNQRVRGVITGDRIFVQVDHARFTSEQITRHELGHDMIDVGEVDVDAVKDKLAEKYTPQQLDEIAEMYIAAYRDSDMTADEAWDEMICDSLGDMNIFAGALSETAERYGGFLKDVKTQAEETRKEARGPPDVVGQENADGYDDGSSTWYDTQYKFSKEVTDPKTLDFLDSQETFTTYKTMQIVDGKLYPPMASRVDGRYEDASILGVWEQATEHPELIRDGNKFKLDKGKGQGSIEAAYNPYMHSSNLVINDQFSGAYKRDNLVTVECEVPISEATSEYRADFAKDTVGWHPWHTGTVAGQLRKAKGIERQVFLSRWIKPVRIVSDAEVAAMYKELLDGTDIAIPDNVVTPSILHELRAVGVRIEESGRVKYSRELDGMVSDHRKLKEGNVSPDVLHKDGIEIIDGSAVKLSRETWAETNKDKMLADLVAAGFDKTDARSWIDDVDSIAAIIAEDQSRLDYIAADNHRGMKPNAEYVVTIDLSTLCAKRLLYQGTYNAIQHELKNRVLTPDDVVRIRKMMADKGLEVPYGICYVESRRKLLGKFAGEWLEGYHGEYVPSLDEVTTTDGLEALRKNHLATYNDFVAAMKKKGTMNPKVVELRTAYREGEGITTLTKGEIKKILRIGGLRVQSFSDFETPHLIDMMQAVMDMSRKGLTSQAYTKVPNFAWVFGDTGIKINLSLIGDVDSNGNLIFDGKEGMPLGDAMALRERYSDNVGTILVGRNEAHIRAALADERIDFVIPFHASGWSKAQYDDLGLGGYLDHTKVQNEKMVDGSKTDGNYYPVDYWDYNVSGNENARTYLEMCLENGRLPKFLNYAFSEDTANAFVEAHPEYKKLTAETLLSVEGMSSLYNTESKRAIAKAFLNFALETNAEITDGYWKLLIDFKMYDNEGNGAPQQKVIPNFNMVEARRVLNEYEGNANKLPVAREVVNEFVAGVNSGKFSREETNLTDIRNENAELKKQVEHWLKQVTVTKNPVLSERSAQKSADRLLEKYESSADAADIAQELKTLGEGIISKENPLSWKAVKTKAIDIAQSIIGEGGNTDTDFDASLAEEYIANDVINMVTGSALRQVSPTIADKYEAAISKTKLRETKKRIDAVERVRERSKKAQDALKQKHKEQMSELRKEKAAHEKEALQNLRDKKNEEIQKRREHEKEALKNLRDEKNNKIQELKDKQEKAQIVKKIFDHTQRLSEKLMRPTDTKHIPQKFHDAVARLLEAVNLEDATEYEYTADGEYKRVKAGEVLGAEPTRRTAAFRELREIYRSMREDFVVDADFEGTPEQKGLLEAVIDMENIPIKAMNLEQLDTVYKTIRAIEGMISNYNKVFNSARWATVTEAAESLRRDNIDKKRKKSWANALKPVQNGLTLDMLTPNTYLHMMGAAGDEIFRMMRNSQDKEIRLIESAVEFNRKLLKSVDTNKIARTANKVTLGGKEVTLSTAQLLEIYVLSKRDAAQEHLTIGGIMPESFTATNGKRIEYTTPIRNISEAEIRGVESYLRENYSELVEIADKMQDYLSTTVSKWGNDASMEVYGYEKFEEENYWKIRSNSQDLQKSVEKDSQVTSVAHKGFTRALMPHAKTSIYIGSIFDTYLNHILEMANYSAWLGTMEDVNRIRNFKFKDGAGNTEGTSHELFDIVHGNGGERYLSKLLADISHNSAKLDNGSMFNALIGKGKAAAVGANLSVVLQQPTAGLRGLAMINPAYLVGGVFTKNGWEKAKKYTAISQWKDWGYFDISTGRTLGDLMLGNASVLDKINNKLMWAAGAMDSLTWGTIWGACELETKHRRKDLKVGSEEFYQETAKRFTEIIDYTQVVDGILQRSGYMRNPDGIAKMATSFMSEPTKIYNMVYSAGYDLRAAQTLDARKKAAKAFTAVTVSVTISNVVNAAVKSIVNAMRDDDKEKEYWEKWLNAFWGFTGEEETFSDYAKATLDSNLLSSFNPATYIPFIKDVLSIIQGYDVTRMDMDGIESAIKAVNNFTKAVSGDGKYTIASASANVFAELSRLFGLPVANIKRDVLAAVQTFAKETDNYLLQYRIDKALYNLNFATNKSSFMVTLYGAYKNDPEAYDIIYKDMYEDIYAMKLKEVENDPDISPEDYPEEARDKTLSWFRGAIEAKMKADEGVESVKDLSSRWLPPEQMREYDATIEGLGTQSDEAKKYAENKASGSSEGQYDALAEAYDSDEETYNAIYDDMISSGVTENEIRSAIETRWKKEQNVKDVEELDKRWLSPDEENLYDSVLGDIQSSSLWARASKDLKAETLEKLYDLAVKTDTETSAGSRMQAKIDGGRAYGIDEGDYILYLMARSMADKPNDNGNLGTYTNDEIKSAIDMLGLSASASAYLWEAAGKNEKSNPWR